MMQRFMAFAARTKVFFSNPNKMLLRQSSSFSHDAIITASDDFKKVMSLLSNAPPYGRGYQLHSDLNALDLTDLLEQHQQYFPLKVIQTSWHTILVEEPVVKPYNLIHFLRWALKNKKSTHLFTTPFLEPLVSSICSPTVPTHLRPNKKDMYLLWDLLTDAGHYNTRILNQFIQFFSIIGGEEEGKAALEIFHKFHLFQCVPNHDTYYFTLQALMTTRCSADMIHQAASICQNMLLLHDDQDYSSQPSNYLRCLSRDDTSGDFCMVEGYLSWTPPLRRYVCTVDETLSDMEEDLTIPDILKIIELCGENELNETPKVSHHNLIHFMKWVWRRRNDYKDLVTTLVLESLVSAICSTTQYSASFGSSIEYPIDLDEVRKDDLLFLWEFLKHIGHNQTGLLNAKILNQLLDFFRFMADKEKAVKVALEVFHKFQVFQCVPNQDTYTLTLQHIFYDNTIRGSTDMLQEATSICQKIILHPETLVPDDDDMLHTILIWFSENNMVKEARALYLAAIEKWKRNPNWSLRLYNLLSLIMIESLCSTKETVHLAFEMVTDMPEETKDIEHCSPIFTALCGFKIFDAAKQLMFQLIANKPLLIGYFDEIIAAYVKANEIGQALEMVILMESRGIPTCYVLSIGLMYDYDSCKVLEWENERIVNIEGIRKILEEAKRKLDSYNLVIASLYHTSIVQYCKLHNFDEALKLFTEMKDHVISFTNLDEYHKLIHKLIQNRGHRKMEKELRIEMHLIFMAYFNRKAKVETIDLGYPPEEFFAALE